MDDDALPGRAADLGPACADGEDAHLIERRRSGQVLLSGGFLEVRRDEVELPSGALATREYIVHPGAVGVLPLLDDGRVLLERQYRYPVGRVMLEIPAGKLDHGEDPWACARRELQEETGYTARQWARAGQLHNAPAYSDEIIHLYVARGLQPGPANLDDEEFLELCAVDEAEFDRLVATGAITDVKTLYALLWLQRWRAGAWPLQWFDGPPIP